MVRSTIWAAVTVMALSEVNAQQIQSDVSDATATMVFFLIVEDLGKDDPTLANGFLASQLAITESEAQQIVEVATQVVAESQQREQAFITNLCNAPNRLDQPGILRTFEERNNQVEGLITESRIEFESRVGSGHLPNLITNWVTGELKSTMTEARPNLSANTIDVDAFYRGACGQSQPEYTEGQ